MNLITGGSGSSNQHSTATAVARRGCVLDLAAPEGDLPRGAGIRPGGRTDRERVIEACRGPQGLSHRGPRSHLKAGRAFWDVNVEDEERPGRGAPARGFERSSHVLLRRPGVRRPSPSRTRPPHWTRSASTPVPRPTAGPSRLQDEGLGIPSFAPHRHRAGPPGIFSILSTGFAPERRSTSSARDEPDPVRRGLGTGRRLHPDRGTGIE